MQKKECVNIATTQIITSKCEKLLGIKIESNLHFEDHIEGICKKAGAKLNALTRIANHMPFQKRKVPMNAFFTSEFSYCPLTWMFHSRKPNNNINNTRSLSRHEQVCLIRLLFERYFSIKYLSKRSLITRTCSSRDCLMNTEQTSKGILRIIR